MFVTFRLCMPWMFELSVLSPNREKNMRREFTIESSEVYMIDPKLLRALGLELLQRSSENAYGSHSEHKNKTSEQRAQEYETLKRKIEREGFRSEFPITVMLLRKDGKKDKILQGHHRLSIAIELDLSVVPVRFVH